MTDVSIRAATPDDRNALDELIAASYATLDRAAYDRVMLAAAMPAISKANPKLLASGTYYVAEIGGEPAGCGGWTREAPHTGALADGVAHIRHFATHPAHLRKGVARRLLDHCLDEAAAAGVRVMNSQSTLLAEPFYASAGFRRVGSGLAEMRPGVELPVVHMECELRGRSSAD